ncbi:MFS transporter [Brevibacterium album]|uniref:MFS transporter n=1 Tax=Brevibacterium album TaxID=417948 RepID=UPI000409B146|nr:MFS transporter [Brevibacterium album]
MIRTIWPLVIAAVSLGIDAYVLAGVLPQMADSLATTVGGIGLGVTVFTGAYALAGPALARRVAAGPTARALLLSLGVFNLGNLLTALAPTLAVFLASRVFAGAAAGVLTALATSTAAALVPAAHRGRAMSLVTFGLSAGTVAGVPLGMLIGEHIGWRWTMGLVVLVGAVSMTALAVRGRSLPVIPFAQTAGMSVLRQPQVLLGIALAFLLGMTSLGLYTYMLPVAEDRGLAGWGFALIWVWGIGGVTGSMLVGRPIDLLGSRRLLPVLAFALLAAFVVIGFAGHGLAWIPAVLVWGAAGWASVPTVQDALTRSRAEDTPSIVAFQMGAMYLGSAAGSALGAAVLERGARAGALPLWAAAVQVLTVVLAFAVTVLGPRPSSVPARE